VNSERALLPSWSLAVRHATAGADLPDPIAEAQWIAGQLHGTVLMVPGAGHYPQAGFPKIVSPAVAAFARQTRLTANRVADLSRSHS
jgi:pimeloyl-ACP methyl ester carboxylesterase